MTDIRTLRDQIAGLNTVEISAMKSDGSIPVLIYRDEVLALLDAHTAAQPAPDAQCPCICHRQQGIMHIAPCCNQPSYGTGDLLEDAALHAMKHPKPAPDAVAEASLDVDDYRIILLSSFTNIAAELHKRGDISGANAICIAIQVIEEFPTEASITKEPRT